MATEKRSLRYEIKMECSREYYPQAQSWVRLNSAAFRMAYPSRWVNNLYFDTHDLDAYNDHISGASERRKLRYRWYGPDVWQARGQLEVKCKQDRAGWKLVQDVPADFDLRACRWTDFKQALLLNTGQASERLLDEMLRVSDPQVVIRYRRDYYVSADAHIRVTLDYHIHQFDQRFTPQPNLLFELPQTHTMVVEFKCDPQHAMQLSDVLAEFPLRVSRHSKYVNAISSQ